MLSFTVRDHRTPRPGDDHEHLVLLKAGEPPPGRIMLLIHGNKVIKELVRRPQLPLGLAELHMDTDRSIYRTLPHSDDGLPAYTEQMNPVTGCICTPVASLRAAPPTAAGLTSTCSATSSSAQPLGHAAPEMLRRPTRTITEYQHGRISAVATIVLIEWMPPPVRDHSLPPEVSGGSRANRDKPERSEKRASRWGPLRIAEILGAGA